MKILIINLSPRPQGTSVMLCHYFAEKLAQVKNMDDSGNTNVVYVKNTVEILDLYKNLEQEEQIAGAIQNADSIVMIGPCYVDSYPADTWRLLEIMSDTPDILHGQALYGFIQGGMPYVHTHESGLRLLRNFANHHNITWKGGFVMGGGAALDGHSIDHVMGAGKIVPAINLFIERIATSQESESKLYEDASVKVPAFVAFLLSLFMRNMIRKRLKSLKVDYKQKTPYLM